MKIFYRKNFNFNLFNSFWDIKFSCLHKFIEFVTVLFSSSLPSSFAEEKYISFLRVYDHYSSWSLKLSRKHCSNNESLYLIARKETFGTSLKFITHAGYYINFDYHTLLQKRSYYRLLFIINRIIARIVITLFLEQSYRNVLLFFSSFLFFFFKERYALHLPKNASYLSKIHYPARYSPGTNILENINLKLVEVRNDPCNIFNTAINFRILMYE